MSKSSRGAGAGLALIAALGIGACGSDSGGSSSTAAGAKPSSGKPVELAYLQKQGDQQYFVDQANGAKAEAKKLGANLKVIDLGEDANLAISAIDTATAQGAKGIAIVVPDQKIGPQVIDKTKQAGVKLLASDDGITGGDGKAAPFVGFDGKDMGKKVGTEAAALFKKAGWTPADTAIISASKQDLSVCTDRVDSAKAAFAAGGGAGVKVIDVGTDNTVTSAQDKTGAIVTANRGIKRWVVWGCNDENVSGVVTALANAKFGADEVIGVGLGGYLACKDWKGGTPTGFKSALYIDGAEVGASAIAALVPAVKDGKPLPANSYAKTKIVNAANWQQSSLKCT